MLQTPKHDSKATTSRAMRKTDRVHQIDQLSYLDDGVSCLSSGITHTHTFSYSHAPYGFRTLMSVFSSFFPYVQLEEDWILLVFLQKNNHLVLLVLTA